MVVSAYYKSEKKGGTKVFFDEKIIELGMEAKSDTDIITQLAEILTQKNIVKKSFASHVLLRERKFPTGLPVKNSLGIAIPHTDSIYVNKSQIAVASLKKPVVFKNMVDATKKVEVSLVFMIAMSKPHEQANLLSNLMNMCQHPGAVEDLIHANNKKTVEEILKDYRLS